MLQGSAGLLTGAGSPGGTVHIVRKRPTETFQAQVEAQVGSWNARRAVADISSPLVSSGLVRARLVALDDHADSFTDYVFRDRRAVYGVVEADVAPGTQLSASVRYRQDTSLNHFGVPYAANGADAGLARSSFWGDTRYRLRRDYTIYTLGLTQRLAGEWNLRSTYSRQKTLNDIDNFNALSGSLNVATGNGLSIANRSRSNNATMTADTLDVYVSGPLRLLGRRHELVLGLNGATYDDEAVGTGYLAGSLPINVYRFDPTALGAVADGTASRTESRTTNGHSFGGLFALHALYTRPDAFQSVVAASPSIWWNGQSVLREEADFRSRIGKAPDVLLRTGLRILVGGREPGPMVGDARALASRMEPLSAHGLRSSLRVLEHESHMSMPAASATDVLRFVTSAP